MNDATIDVLERSFMRARQRASEAAVSPRFKGLHPEQARRAHYFSELADDIANLGLSNPHERSALGLEPAHPVPPARMERELEKLGGPLLPLKKAGMSLVSLPMVARAAPESEASMLHRRVGSHTSLQLLDPLYGFVFFRENGRYRNHCLALDFWNSRLATMPPGIRAALWENRADDLLSGGALAGRLLFDNLVPAEPDAIKRSAVAELVVRSQAHLNEVVSALQEGAKAINGVQLWFRGQGQDYRVPDRTALAQRGLVPYSNIRESSLVPSLFRRFDSHLESFASYESLLRGISAWVEASKVLLPDDEQLRSAFHKQQRHANAAEGLTSYQRGLMLQQYGAPTSYLDITRDVRIAAWFATHDCTAGDDGRLTCTAKRWDGDGSHTWPTIFVFPLVEGEHPFLDLSSMLSDKTALRPHRQSCGLLGGAGNLARNYCARYVGLKLRLHPDFRLDNPFPASYLFPDEQEDQALSLLRSLNPAPRGSTYPLTYVAAS